MSEPLTDRMPWPGYDPAREGAELLPWSWAVQRLERSPRYWLATAAGGRPHLSAVWGVWVDGRLVFSTGRETRKARHLLASPRCSVATESAGEAVVVHGVAEEIGEKPLMDRVEAAYVAKYGSSPRVGDSPVFAVSPRFATGLTEGDMATLPTRWRFPAG